MLKKFCKVFVLGLIVAGTFLGCDNVAEGQWGNLNPKNYIPFTHAIVDAPEPLKDLGYWKTSNIDGDANSVAIDFARDVDFFGWTRENGEFLPLPMRRGGTFGETLKCEKGTRTFTFKEPGTYIFHIYQKKNVADNFNIDDKEFRGKVVVGPQAIKITGIGNAEAVSKHAVYKVMNDSTHPNYKSYVGNVMDELVFVYYKEQRYDRKRKDNYGIYDVKFKYTGVNLKQNEVKYFLFPMNVFSDTRYGGLILKPLTYGKSTVYISQTTSRVNNKRDTPYGMYAGHCNGIFHDIGNKEFECVW